MDCRLSRKKERKQKNQVGFASHKKKKKHRLVQFYCRNLQFPAGGNVVTTSVTCSSAPSPLSSSASTTKDGPTQQHPRAHNSSTRFSPISSLPHPCHPHTLPIGASPPMTPSAKLSKTLEPKKTLFCDICNAGWHHMDCLQGFFPAIPAGNWNASPPPLLTLASLQHFRHHSPILNADD